MGRRATDDLTIRANTALKGASLLERILVAKVASYEILSSTSKIVEHRGQSGDCPGWIEVAS